MDPRTDLDMKKIGDFCRRWKIRELALFGSAVRNQLRADSDLDFLVEFEPDTEIGFLALAAMARELSGIVGRKVDLVPKPGLKPLIRDEVLSEAAVLYAA